MKMKKSIDGVVAKVHVESFGSGTAIRALVALRAGRSYTDPRLREALELPKFCELTARESQPLQCLAMSQSNMVIAVEFGITAEPIRDHVSVLQRKLGARNRTQAVGKAEGMGLIRY